MVQGGWGREGEAPAGGEGRRKGAVGVPGDRREGSHGAGEFARPCTGSLCFSSERKRHIGSMQLMRSMAGKGHVG